MEKRKYILGHLSGAERDRIDDLLMDDDTAYDEMLAEEDELIDSYVRNELGDEERRDFEAALHRSARLRERLDLARILHAGLPDIVTASPRMRSVAPMWYALAAAVAIVSLVGAFALMKTRRAHDAQALEAAKRRPVNSVIAEKAAAPVTASAVPLPASTIALDAPAPRKVSSIMPVNIVTFVLSGATTRGNNESLRLDVPSEAREVALDVNLDGETVGLFNAVLRNGRGREVWTQHNRPMSQLQSGQGIEVRVPARKLDGGRYELAIYDARSSDNDPITFVEFEIVRK